MVKNDLLQKGYSTFSVRETFSAQDIARVHSEFDELEPARTGSSDSGDMATE